MKKFLEDGYWILEILRILRNSGGIPKGSEKISGIQGAKTRKQGSEQGWKIGIL
jgi:hypothetical protein